MAVAPLHVRARVRHEPDRSYAVLVDGPEGEVLVGTTRRTGEVLTIAHEGAARVFAVAVGQIARSLDVAWPRPPYGRDGQWVRIVAVEDPSDVEEVEMLGVAGQVHWFGAESAWFVTVPGYGTGIYPGELLDFEAVISAEEEAALRAYTSGGADPS
ncbi:hypothetical protein OG218_00475 [Kineococcus sp. NBC_00420]|uniref:hypothetical protein n=1 Tax=Kineococcus sp. NBC_00420 TaxID=2903564 RepID=UPI002E1F4C0C